MMRKILLPILSLMIFSCSYRADLSQYKTPDKISVEEVGNVIVIMPRCNEMDEAFIFYPGGLVEAEAYIPLGVSIAEELKMPVFIQKMPFDLAILGLKRLEKILDEYSYIDSWHIGGHSLGGVTASMWISDNPGIFESLTLMASYPLEKKPLNKADISVLTIRGSEDGLVRPEDFLESLRFLPDNRTVYEIKGGNHALFGSYGTQKGDGTAVITEEEQRNITAAVMKEFFENF